MLPSLLVPRTTDSLPSLSLSSRPFIPLRHCDDQRHSFPSGTSCASIAAPRVNGVVNFHAQHARRRELSLYFLHPSHETDTTVRAARYNMSRKKARDERYTCAAVRFVTPFLPHTLAGINTGYYGVTGLIGRHDKSIHNDGCNC